MCVRISDSVAFWWPPATRSKESKFLVLETSCITHTINYTFAITDWNRKDVKQKAEYHGAELFIEM